MLGGFSFGSYRQTTSFGHSLNESTNSKNPLPFAPSYKHHHAIPSLPLAFLCAFSTFFSLHIVKCPFSNVGLYLCSCASALEVSDNNVEQSTRECSNSNKTESNKHSVKYFLSSLLSFIHKFLSLLTDINFSFD